MARKDTKRKAPAMPPWFWYSTMDGCWCCKNPGRGCSRCRQVMEYRKAAFAPKEKGAHAGRKSNEKPWRTLDYCLN